ncbi:hypothetical protein TorRG33x02_134140 [Trema orientale]|uniref:Transmembrane protein n=1 Tax=Trema orientale TaxID=63057 RepID=A0A2P5EZ10_TREOI|nr:hypothetical protein TorRG33x02_134140 [Trema orientale]
MGLPKPSMLLFLLLLVVSASEKSAAVQARLLSSAAQQRYANVFATLGLVCKCCDGPAGECTSSWTKSCSKVQCLPWKQHYQ